jgi:hypothetical protein
MNIYLLLKYKNKMKLIVLALVVVAIAFGVFMWKRSREHFADNPIGGSYLDSCSLCSYNNSKKTLTCMTCVKEDGSNGKKTSLPVTNKNANISNCNGTLKYKC